MNALNVLWIVTLFLGSLHFPGRCLHSDNLGFLMLCTTNVVLGCVVLVLFFVGGLGFGCFFLVPFKAST